MLTMVNNTARIVVIGAGHVGSTAAYALMLRALVSEIVLIDSDAALAEETAAMIAKEGGIAQVFAADWTRAADCKAYVNACADAWGSVDFLHNNVGIGSGDAGRLPYSRYGKVERCVVLRVRDLVRTFPRCNPARRRSPCSRPG